MFQLIQIDIAAMLIGGLPTRNTTSFGVCVMPADRQPVIFG